MTMDPSDPALQEFQEDLHVLDRKEMYKLHWHIWHRRFQRTHPDMGLITILITLGEILLWFAYPPSLQSNWTALAVLWLAAWVISISITTSRRHWIELLNKFTDRGSLPFRGHVIQSQEKTIPRAHWLGED